MNINFRNIEPKLTVVGAGPGDPDLITLKAIKALRNADVVLYDALANAELLDYCLPTTELIFVGKRGHQKGITQDEINFLIVEKALEKGHVVRLKGGDPFIFGRGMEEIEYAAARDLEVAYVPGISSVLSGGKHLIPLTDRRVSDGFWVITGHKSDKTFSEDLNLAAQSSTTVVLLMAMSKLSFISEKYIELGRGKMPFCIIQNASTDKEKKIEGNIEDMLQLAVENNMSNPAIIIIGEVVKLKDNINLDFALNSFHYDR